MTFGRVWKLRYHLFALLLTTMALTFAVVTVVVVFWRVPQIEHASLQALRNEVQDVAERLELLLGARQARLELMASRLRGRTPEQAGEVLASNMHGDRLFRAVYLVSPRGRVEAVGLAPESSAQGQDFLGSDLSANALFKAVSAGRPTAWSGRLLSSLSGALVVGVAHRDRSGRVLIGEVPTAVLLDDLRSVTSEDATMVWVVDDSGEVIADTDGRHMGRLNLHNWPMLQAALQGRPVPADFEFEHRPMQAALAPAPTLGWYVVSSMARGWGHPDVQRTALYASGGFLGCLLIGLLVAPFWASRLVRPLQEIVARAALNTAGRAGGGKPWPRGTVAEFNHLSSDLEAMGRAVQERERKLQALFNVAPVPMVVTDMDDAHCFLDVNSVWCEETGYTRAEAIGLNSLELGMWSSSQRHEELLYTLDDGSFVGEVEIICKNGEAKLYKSFGRVLSFKNQNLVVWGSINIGPLRAIEQELRTLNYDLEARVAQRAEALATANEELSDTLAQLRSAQTELVQTEKMAALGALVAGVAHELNTPLGNGVMAISAMADETRRFRAAMRAGLRRADLQAWVDGVAQGCDIAGRNLRRAADLVHNFKQVAVDQTSSQRRSFELGEVVHELVVSLRPTFSRTPYRIVVEVPQQGLRLDSYPGPLGQALANLIQNAVRHGFDGREHGTVCITAGRDGSAEGAGAAERIWLRVQDDGVGIPPEIIGRIFDPFMTTKMGQGGTGLGLHISYNAVVQLLGGTLTVDSAPGQGATFEMRLPPVAPRTVPMTEPEAVL
ncbi:ATP-binding protein [Pseudorhodoferax sp.]|uniref:ATP-binding protein n=1 Tax=Pseudorhodoferax sp. TaxID=1993553 RepID=UPI002DD61F0E|nr:ATP-binding protein [Pseudorhodoferax sp.]